MAEMKQTTKNTMTGFQKLFSTKMVKVFVAVVVISFFMTIFLSTFSNPVASYLRHVAPLTFSRIVHQSQLFQQEGGLGRLLHQRLAKKIAPGVSVLRRQEGYVDSDYLVHHKVTFWRGRPIQVGAPHWQPLDNNSKAFVYSAHFDDIDRLPNGTHVAIVRIVGLAIKPLPYREVWCHFQQSADDVSRSVRGEMYHFRGRGCKCYVGVFVDCPTTDDTAFPYAVTLENRNHSFQATVLKVHYSKDFSSYHNASEGNDRNTTHAGGEGNNKNITNSRELYKWNVTRCFPSLFNFKHHTKLAEMVAASRALGVDHFVFYWHSVSPEVGKILQILQAEGVAEFYPWNLHLGQVHYLAQFSAIQDCLYRHLHSSRYLLFGDLDEQFIPRRHPQLLPLLEEEFAKNPECGAMLFRQVFFDMQTNSKIPRLDNASTLFLENHSMPILTHIVRNLVPNRPADRSKPAADPRKVLVGSVHIVEKLRKGFKQCTMDPEKGLLYHYRQGARMSENKTDDTFMWRFADDIVKETQRILKRMSVAD